MDSAVKQQLELLRSRLRKVADNLFQITNNAHGIEWRRLAEKLNMAVSHLDTLGSGSTAAGGETGHAEFQPQSESLLASIVVQPVVATPDPLTIPNVLLRKRAIPEVEALHQTSVNANQSAANVPGKHEIVQLHDEMLKHDEELVEVLDWLEERKNAFVEAQRQMKSSLALVQQPISL